MVRLWGQWEIGGNTSGHDSAMSYTNVNTFVFVGGILSERLHRGK